MVDLYCERLGSGIWAEPVNATTNLAFLLVAWLAWRAAKRARVLSIDIRVLIGLTALIAVGSGLFHTLATTWARVLDELPILLFQLAFVWIYCRRIIGMRPMHVAGIVLAYLAAAFWARQFPHLLNGSLTYAPPVIALMLLGGYHYATVRSRRTLLLWASLMFLASVGFRTADAAVCPYFPLGTHFLWHVLNAVLLYLLMHSLTANIGTARSMNKRPAV